MCISNLPACVYVYYMQACFLWRPENGIRSPGTIVTDGCEAPYRCWELNTGLHHWFIFAALFLQFFIKLL